MRHKSPFNPQLRTTHFNIVLWCIRRCSAWCPWRLAIKASYELNVFSHTFCYVPHSTHPAWFEHHNTWWTAQITIPRTVQFSPFSCHLSLPLKDLLLESLRSVSYVLTSQQQFLIELLLLDYIINRWQENHLFASVARLHLFSYRYVRLFFCFNSSPCCDLHRWKWRVSVGVV